MFFLCYTFYDNGSHLDLSELVMHLLQVDCDIHYDGRGKTFMPRGIRLVMIKADNSIEIHQDKDIRPLNYMLRAQCIHFVTDSDGYEHLIASAKDETIDVTLYEILFEVHMDVNDSDELERHGTERQIQGWLGSDGFKKVFGDRVEFVMREYQTGRGPVDLLGYDTGDQQVALIEVKRVAKKSDVFQLLRYRSALLEHANDEDMTFVTTAKKDAMHIETRRVHDPHMYLVATRFRPHVKEECERFGIVALNVPKDCV